MKNGVGNAPPEAHRKVQINVLQRTGRVHLQMKEGCEDRVFIWETPGFLFYGLADGQSGRKYGADGGSVCMSALALFLADCSIQKLIAHPFPDELPCQIVRKLRQSILELEAARGGDFSDYASTLLSIAIDPASGDYILIHLGDGCAVSISSEDTVQILSAPDNGHSCSQTWLTTSANAVSHLRVYFGTIHEIKRIFILSDGANMLCCGKHVLRQAKPLFQQGTADEIGEYLNSAEPKDDATCIMIEL